MIRLHTYISMNNINKCYQQWNKLKNIVKLSIYVFVTVLYNRNFLKRLKSGKRWYNCLQLQKWQIVLKYSPWEIKYIFILIWCINNKKRRSETDVALRFDVYLWASPGNALSHLETFPSILNETTTSFRTWFTITVGGVQFEPFKYLVTRQLCRSDNKTWHCQWIGIRQSPAFNYAHHQYIVYWLCIIIHVIK